MAKFDLKAYARQGAAARVAELNAELAAIFRVFPELRSGAAKATGYGSCCEEAKASRDDGGSEGGSVEADEEVLGGEESEEGLDGLDTRRHRLQ